MALSFKKDLEKYKEIDEDEILNKLSAEELKQLENALEEMDPEVRQQGFNTNVGMSLSLSSAGDMASAPGSHPRWLP